MQFYYIVYLVISAIILFIFIFQLLRVRKTESTKLFSRGLQAENKGLYEETIANYEHALLALKKRRSNHKFQNQIKEKIKVPTTLLTYDKDQKFVRNNDSWIK